MILLPGGGSVLVGWVGWGVVWSLTFSIVSSFLRRSRFRSPIGSCWIATHKNIARKELDIIIKQLLLSNTSKNDDDGAGGVKL